MVSKFLNVTASGASLPVYVSVPPLLTSVAAPAGAVMAHDNNAPSPRTAIRMNRPSIEMSPVRPGLATRSYSGFLTCF